ncbi:MAG: hypothetical protein O7G13_02440 [Alphaproteobacteria bacterium]|nr:hypothetical protein [Alphaproteobacteria bacterium]
MIVSIIAGVLVGAPVAASAQSSPSIIYPARGQTVQQPKNDEGQCYVWARDYTGIDPFRSGQQSNQAANTQPQFSGDRVRGAARGAIGGALIGKIASDDAGKGAAIVGTMAGGVRSRRRQERQMQQAVQAQSATASTFERAFGACMEARGCVVK